MFSRNEKQLSKFETDQVGRFKNMYFKNEHKVDVIVIAKLLVT
jgi:hypothetical protein